jgi:hypothetical protein
MMMRGRHPGPPQLFMPGSLGLPLPVQRDIPHQSLVSKGRKESSGLIITQP